MAYSKHNFQSGQTLTANQMNEMDTQIFENEKGINEVVSDKSKSTTKTKLAYTMGTKEYEIPEMSDVVKVADHVTALEDSVYNSFEIVLGDYTQNQGYIYNSTPKTLNSSTTAKYILVEKKADVLYVRGNTSEKTQIAQLVDAPSVGMTLPLVDGAESYLALNLGEEKTINLHNDCKYVFFRVTNTSSVNTFPIEAKFNSDIRNVYEFVRTESQKIRFSVDAIMDNGNIYNGSDGSTYTSDTYTSIKNRFNTSCLFIVQPQTKIHIKCNHSLITDNYVYEFGSNMNFLRVNKNVANDTDYIVGENTKYIWIMSRLSSETDDSFDLTITSDYLVRKSPKANLHAGTSQSISLVYRVNDNTYTSGRLMLPPNYKIDGKPVPLAVFFHGTNGYVSWVSSDIGDLASGSSYNNFIRYIRDEGYAIFDCFGWTSKHYSIGNGSSANTFNTVIARRAFEEGVKYVTSRYNIDGSNLFAFCKSLGGQLASYYVNHSEIAFKAIGMLCPSLDLLQRPNLGYNLKNRTVLASEWNLTGDVSSVFLTDNFSNTSTNGRKFISDNLDTFIEFNTGWDYIGKLPADKLTESLNNSKENASACTYDTNPTTYRIAKVPVKIWCATDDTQTPFTKHVEYVNQIKNVGGSAEYREMPTGTGGHHSVDTDASALKVSTITTKLGITHQNIPRAYTELVEFFEKYR